MNRRQFINRAGTGILGLSTIATSSIQLFKCRGGKHHYNVLLIMSDEHNPAMMGCSGHPFVKTPNLDRLAENGVRFSNMYCNSPLCVPSRASSFTGKYAYEVNSFDNSSMYDASVPSFGTIFKQNDIRTTATGKLDFTPGRDYGFNEIKTAHREGAGDIMCLFRNPVGIRKGARDRIRAIVKEYNRFDSERTQVAQNFFEEGGLINPWLFYVGFILPHFPFAAPQSGYDMYPFNKIDMPENPPGHLDNLHPVIRDLRRHFEVDEPIPEELSRKCRSAYYAMTTALDTQVGQVLDALEQSGEKDRTYIIYTSDHGEMLDEHGMWYKCCMYEASAAVPLIISGPDLPKGAVVETPVSLVDLFPTLCEMTGTPVPYGLRGHSLLPLCHGESGDHPGFAYSEYNGHGTPSGMFMIRKDKWKYIHYVGFPPQLFDMESDPHEFSDLGADEKYQGISKELDGILRDEVNPEEVDRLAKEHQNKRLRKYYASMIDAEFQRVLSDHIPDSQYDEIYESVLNIVTA